MKRKNIDPLLSEMTAAAPPAVNNGEAHVELPAATSNDPPIDLDYRPLTSGERWRVEKFEFLALEFGLQTGPADGPPKWSELMAEFHEVVAPQARWWLFVRRLFGVMPLLPGANAHPDEMRAWRREELCDAFGISKDQLKEELEAIRAQWGNHVRNEAATVTEAAPEAQSSKLKAQSEHPLLVDENLLEEFGFEESMFKVEWKEKSGETEVEVKRPDDENRREKNWFCSRLADWARMLREPMAHAVARECLLDELQLKRIEVDMFQHRSGSPAHSSLQKTRAQLQGSYSSRLNQLQEMFPEMGVAGKVAFKGVTSDWVMAYTEAMASGDFRRMDRVSTAAEIAADLRQSVQTPLPKYRLGQTLYIIEAMNGLFDPNWRSKLKPSFLRKLDTGFAEAVDRVRREGNEALVDLMKEGASGEYADDLEAIT